VPWLAKRYALTVLPSLSALQSLRHFARVSRAPEPFIGIGDPTLEGPPGSARGVNLAKLYARGAVADVGELRKLPPLPDTADELRAMARTLGVAERHLYLGSRATERGVRALDLQGYRVVAFATHGLMAGEFSDIGEPALVMTPPAEATAEDDGVLTASEIASLKLDADWIILSACNTAAADGTPGAEGLSGLARAFFYAGSRALLVSHWAVLSDATVKLTTRMLSEAAADPKLGRAEAHRRAMLALAADKDNPHYAHPMFWAPFVVVGEGGAAQ
jgi:CHAT domain-containing protein